MSKDPRTRSTVAKKKALFVLLANRLQQLLHPVAHRSQQQLADMVSDVDKRKGRGRESKDSLFVKRVDSILEYLDIPASRSFSLSVALLSRATLLRMGC